MISQRNKIKKNYSYTFLEISRLLNTHIRTVQTWCKIGMEVLDPNSKPFLVLGSELKRFLRARRLNRRIKLQSDQFYCLKCRAARRALPGFTEEVCTHKIIGKDKLQIILSGLCEVCKSKIIKFGTIGLQENALQTGTKSKVNQD